MPFGYGSQVLYHFLNRWHFLVDDFALRHVHQGATHVPLHLSNVLHLEFRSTAMVEHVSQILRQVAHMVLVILFDSLERRFVFLFDTYELVPHPLVLARFVFDYARFSIYDK